MIKRNIIDRIVRFYTYLRHGHGSVLSFIISLINTVIIQYTLFISKIPILRGVFSNIFLFAGIFLLIYVPVCVLIGRLDMKKGSFRKTVEISAEVSPIMMKMLELEKMLQHMEKRLEELERRLESYNAR